MPSLKQIGTICFLSIISIPPTFADNETPSYITNSSNCNQGVLQTDTGPAALEANYSANTINTTWYSNGTTLSGNGVPSSCIYDAALVPPTPDARPGYTFGGWRVHVAAPACLIPSTDVSNNAEDESMGCLDINGAGLCAGKGGFDQNAPNYGISDPGEWGVSWSNGDKVTGVALCSAHGGNNHSDQWGGNSSDWTSDETTLTSATGETQYCWCKATHYTANNAQQCSLSSPSCVFENNYGSASECAFNCANDCADDVRYHSAFRAAVFTGLVAQ